jgi:hypothetical protein
VSRIQKGEQIVQNQNIEDQDLSALSQHLARAVGIIERMRARRNTKDTAAGGEGGREFRRYVGGPLNERGEADINKRFEGGQGDTEIALSMGISLAGVSRRRTMWRRGQAK